MSSVHPSHTDKKFWKNFKEVTKARTAEQTIQMLKRHATSSEEHMQDRGSEVPRDASLEQLEVAPEDPPMT